MSGLDVVYDLFGVLFAQGRSIHEGIQAMRCHSIAFQTHGPSAFVAILVCAALAACATPDKAWRSATETDTPESYREFQARYPEDPRVEAAAERARSLEWRNAVEEDSLAAYRGFLEKHRGTSEAALASAAITRLAWGEATREDTVEGYRRFERAHPDSEFAAALRTRMAELEWEEARRVDTAEGYLRFMEQYPDSNEAQSAAKRAASTMTWLDCKRTIEGSDSTLLVAAARERLEELALSGDALAPLEAYVELVEESPRMPEVLERYASLVRQEVRSVVGNRPGAIRRQAEVSSCSLPGPGAILRLVGTVQAWGCTYYSWPRDHLAIRGRQRKGFVFVGGQGVVVDTKARIAYVYGSALAP